MRYLALLLFALPLAGCAAIPFLTGHVSCPVTPHLALLHAQTLDGKAAKVCVDVSTGEFVDLSCCINS